MLSLVPLLLPSPALACGGMFCDTSTATTIVVQAAERIVFSFDEGMLDTEVQIAFQGEADEFAWVVPVPVEPELYVSNDALFTVLGEATAPQYVVNTQFTGAPQGDGCNGSSETASEDGVGQGAGWVGVSVAATETVGPYDTVVLQATNADILVAWLQEQGYSLPDTLSTQLEPYVAAGQYFVAPKLSSDKDTGDLAPLGMRYAASAASVPIQLTAVAAVPDLPIEVFVLGPARAVPDNYLHVQLNDAALDWFGGMADYADVVSRAVDEAGGQAFVTEFAGPAMELGVPSRDEPLVDVPAVVWDDEWLDLRAMAKEIRPVWWVGAIASSPLPVSAQLLTLIVRYVPPPEGVSAEELYSCTSCYEDEVEAPDFDPAVATAALEAEILEPMAAQQDRLDAADVVTRLFTTMDASERTADPLFAFNADVPQAVSKVHTATDTSELNGCGDRVSRRLGLDDGRIYQVADPTNPSLSPHEGPAALVIEDLGASGPGTVLFDGHDAADADAASTTSGCAEGNRGKLVLSPAILLLAGLLRRRRR